MTPEPPPFVFLGTPHAHRGQTRHWEACLVHGQPYIHRWKRGTWWAVRWDAETMLRLAHSVTLTPDASIRLGDAVSAAVQAGSRRAEAAHGDNSGVAVGLSAEWAQRLCDLLVETYSKPEHFAPGIVELDPTWPTAPRVRFEWVTAERRPQCPS